MGWWVVFGDYRVSPNFLVVLGLLLWLRFSSFMVFCGHSKLFWVLLNYFGVAVKPGKYFLVDFWGPIGPFCGLWWGTRRFLGFTQLD